MLRCWCLLSSERTLRVAGVSEAGEPRFGRKAFGEQKIFEGKAHIARVHEREIWTEKRGAGGACAFLFRALFQREKTGFGGAHHEMVLVCVPGDGETGTHGSVNQGREIDVRRDIDLSRAFEWIVRTPMPRIAR